MQLRFKKSTVIEALAHCRTGKPSTLYDIETGPGLWLVGDEGIYLMSNGTLENRPIVFAEECNPNTMSFDEWWEAKRCSFGGDDGVEFISPGDVEPILAQCDAYLVIDITPDFYALMAD